MDERERLIEIMKSQELNAKQLSERINVSAGTISNILGGRNKPSLELLQNISNHFPFISPTWLFLGFGEMYIEGYVPPHARHDSGEDGMMDNPSLPRQLTQDLVSSMPLSSKTRTIEKLVIFYSDGTFEER